MANPFQQTLDPLSLAAAPRSTPTGGVEAILEIAFHPDLGRIGERASLGNVQGVHAFAPVGVGRESPAFFGADGPEARTLRDPCLSRSQATISWQPERGQFRVDAAIDARRPTTRVTMDGRLLEETFVDPGTLVALGDRVLLLLDVRPPPAGDLLGLLGNSGLLSALRGRIRAVATFDDTVLVRGETGTGKELVAQAIHRASHRTKQAFVALNCAALPESLIESELFGYARGAFSGAAQGKAGLFRAAEGGTLFLDEIGEMPLALQAKLLRVLESKRIRPVGGQQEEPVDVRIVCATHRDLLADVRAGRFREDLFARLESPLVLVPPLRDRREDVPLLFATFLKRRALELAGRDGRVFETTALGRCWQEASAYRSTIPLEFFTRLLAHDWPRNVRELDKLAAEVATAIVHGQPLPVLPARAFGPAVERPSDLPRGPTPLPPLPARSPTPTPPPPPDRASTPSPEAENRGRPRIDRAELERVLEANEFNATDTARELGLPYSTLDRWMRELGVVRPRDLTRADIEPAWARANGDVRVMARSLRVSFRGLKVRLKELGMSDGE